MSPPGPSQIISAIGLDPKSCTGVTVKIRLWSWTLAAPDVVAFKLSLLQLYFSITGNRHSDDHYDRRAPSLCCDERCSPGGWPKLHPACVSEQSGIHGEPGAKTQ